VGREIKEQRLHHYFHFGETLPKVKLGKRKGIAMKKAVLWVGGLSS